MHPPPSPARTDFTLITERTPESSGCNSVYSVDSTVYVRKEEILLYVYPLRYGRDLTVYVRKEEILQYVVLAPVDMKRFGILCGYRSDSTECFVYSRT